jgi:Family of unknown function (DUF6073)
MNFIDLLSKNVNLETGKILWGRYVNPVDLPELFQGEGAPAKHVRHQHPPAGVDNLHLKTVDTFFIPKMGKFTVDFSGYFQVTRGNPSTPDWATATVYVNFTDLRLFGKDNKLGEITVDLNPNVISAGNTFPAAEGLSAGTAGAAACKINVAARFTLHDMNMTLFNKTPIILKNDEVQGIPTIGEGGNAEVSALPLYKWDAPNDDYVGYVQELQYKVGAYMTREETLMFRASRNPGDFARLHALLRR